MWVDIMISPDLTFFALLFGMAARRPFLRETTLLSIQ